MDFYTLRNDNVMKVHVETEMHPNLLRDGPVSHVTAAVIVCLSVCNGLLTHWPPVAPTTLENLTLSVCFMSIFISIECKV